MKTYDCQVDTLTLSIEQKTLAEDRIREAGLEDRIRVHLLDYRKIPAEFENAFDAFVSIEMIEVGQSTVCCPYLLSPEAGLARRTQVLQHLFQTSGLCTQVHGCCGCYYIFNTSRVEIYRPPVRVPGEYICIPVLVN